LQESDFQLSAAIGVAEFLQLNCQVGIVLLHMTITSHRSIWVKLNVAAENHNLNNFEFYCNVFY
jgi:hypothetical protein